jgi:hypothetical protein
MKIRLLALPLWLLVITPNTSSRQQNEGFKFMCTASGSASDLFADKSSSGPSGSISEFNFSGGEKVLGHVGHMQFKLFYAQNRMGMSLTRYDDDAFLAVATHNLGMVESPPQINVVELKTKRPNEDDATVRCSVYQ